ncbi:hypothetical protein HPP92_008645 [Vanilla planifolia]|uniref:Uncharacterized protein n=1 Tax=Vanilla planifolia TaxID=51239 RepID=A0A835V7F0_VANPL|nr:hypothetical protein HPP92_008645 [Vanilla planifolia]
MNTRKYTSRWLGSRGVEKESICRERSLEFELSEPWAWGEYPMGRKSLTTKLQNNQHGKTDLKAKQLASATVAVVHVQEKTRLHELVDGCRTDCSDLVSSAVAKLTSTDVQKEARESWLKLR